MPATLRELPRERQEKFLPKLLAYKKDGFRNTDTPAILEGNFFDPQVPIADDFDVVLGNPPWVGRNQTADKQVEELGVREITIRISRMLPGQRQTKSDLLPSTADRTCLYVEGPDLSRRAMAMYRFCCHLKALLNQTDEFQEAWFRRFQVDRILHLADYRKFLFAGRRVHALLRAIEPTKPEPSTHRLEYVVPKVCQQDPRSGLIPISPEDRKWISLQDVLDQAKRSRASVLWKSYLWGTVRDVRFLDYLSRLKTLDDIAGEPDSGKRWIKGHGFKPWYQIGFDEHPETYGEPKPIPGQLSDPFVRTTGDSLRMFILPDASCIPLKERLKSLRCKGRLQELPKRSSRHHSKGFTEVQINGSSNHHWC